MEILQFKQRRQEAQEKLQKAQIEAKRCKDELASFTLSVSFLIGFDDKEWGIQMTENSLCHDHPSSWETPDNLTQFVSERIPKHFSLLLKHLSVKTVSVHTRTYTNKDERLPAICITVNKTYGKNFVSFIHKKDERCIFDLTEYLNEVFEKIINKE